MRTSPPPARILVVEDNSTLRRVLRYSLARRGDLVEAAATGADALLLARRHRPDLVLLDLGLPDIDGLELCRILRRETAAPILVLTARLGDEIREESLRAGAADHMTKPFSMDALRARIGGLLGRDHPGDGEGAAGAGGPGDAAPREVLGLALDPAGTTVRRSGVTIRLSPKEYGLLAQLLEHPGEVTTREQITEAVWGEAVGSNTLNVHVRWLREKLAALGPPGVRIVSVFGIGYRLDIDVEE